jgi:hypothetical protein
VNCKRIKNVRKVNKASLSSGSETSLRANRRGLRSLVEAIDNRKWAASFNDSRDVLEHLAEEAGEDFKQGKTRPLPF